MPTIKHLDTLPAAQAEHLLFRRLFDHMLADTPRVPVTPSGMTLVTSWRDDILEGDVHEHAFGTWGQLFENIRWDDVGTDAGPCCGAALLQFLGHFGEAMQQFGPTTMPLYLALIALPSCQAENGVVAVTVDNDNRWSIHVTSRGTAAFGLAGRISFAERVPPFDVPQELFEHYYTGEVVGGPATLRARQQTR